MLNMFLCKILFYAIISKNMGLSPVWIACDCSGVPLHWLWQSSQFISWFICGIEVSLRASFSHQWHILTTMCLWPISTNLLCLDIFVGWWPATLLKGSHSFPWIFSGWLYINIQIFLCILIFRAINSSQQHHSPYLSTDSVVDMSESFACLHKVL